MIFQVHDLVCKMDLFLSWSRCRHWRVCVCVCTYERVCVCVCVYVCVRTSVCVCVCGPRSTHSELAQVLVLAAAVSAAPPPTQALVQPGKQVPGGLGAGHDVEGGGAGCPPRQSSSSTAWCGQTSTLCLHGPGGSRGGWVSRPSGLVADSLHTVSVAKIFKDFLFLLAPPTLLPVSPASSHFGNVSW